MENPAFSPTVPFRPIPIYGNRAQLRVSSQPPADESSSYGAKSQEDPLMLAKQINLISHMSRLRALRDYRFNQPSQFGNSPPAQMLNGINKFSAKNLAMIGEIGRSHAIAQRDVQNMGQPKLIGYSVGKVQCQGLSPPAAPATETQRSPVDSSTVPVIIACGNPFPSQYGYGRKVFPCPQCRYTTDRRNNLKRHMLTMHQTCAKTLECCGIVFATKASLREHAMIFHYHGYTCFYCGRRFCRKALLKRHLSVHSGQKDFVCPVCDYATSHKSNLERHRKVHCRPEEQKDADDGECRSRSTECEPNDFRSSEFQSTEYRSNERRSNECGSSEYKSHGCSTTECGSRDTRSSWQSGHDTDDNNNTNVASSSDDEDMEINVDSD